MTPGLEPLIGQRRSTPSKDQPGPNGLAVFVVGVVLPLIKLKEPL
jgi:hypothetical protein